MNTSQPNHNSDGSDDLDTLLGAAYTHLVNDLTATLDLNAGAAQATHPATYSALTNDLAQQLDLDAGLATIVTGGSLPPPNDTQPHQPASPHPATDQAQDVEHLRFLDAPTRLALRAAPAFRSLRDALELGELIVSAQDVARDRALDRALGVARARALDRDRDLALARALDVARDRARDRALALARALVGDRALARALADALDHALDHARDLARALDRDRDLALARARDPDLARARDPDLARARDLARDLARALDRDRDCDLALARALDRALDSALALARHLALDRPIGDAFQLALAVALGLTHHAASGYGRILGLRLDLGQGDRLDKSTVSRARIALAEVGDDFVGADLRSAQMNPDIDGLAGVRWSNATQWPSEWVDYVRAASDEIERGLFQITPTDGRRSPTYAAT